MILIDMALVVTIDAMPFEVKLVREKYPTWPPRIHTTYRGNVTTDEVVACINSTISLLDQRTEPLDLVGIFEQDTNMSNAKGVLFQKPLLDQLTWHDNLDQIVIVDLNKMINGDFLKHSLQTMLSKPELKISIFSSMDELDAYLANKYAPASHSTEPSSVE